MPTQAQVDAAHSAWEATVSEWQVRSAGHEVWLVERRADAVFDPTKDYANEIAYHKFDGPEANAQARFRLRDMCIRAALEAVEKIKTG
jgi:hypothetical protein